MGKAAVVFVLMLVPGLTSAQLESARWPTSVRTSAAIRTHASLSPLDTAVCQDHGSLVAMGFATVRDGRVYVMQETWVSFDAEKKECLTREAFPDFLGQVYDYRSGRKLASFDPFLGFRIH